MNQTEQILFGLALLGAGLVIGYHYGKKPAQAAQAAAEANPMAWLETWGRGI